jgi:hypothetical protein
LTPQERPRESTTIPAPPDLESPRTQEERKPDAATEPAAAIKSQPAEQDPPIRALRPIKPRRRKRMRLGEAFRREGLDERAVAQTWVVVVEKLRRGKGSAGESVEKLLVDVLKECDRILDPPRTAGVGSVDVPTVVNLYHNVPRPVRDPRPEGGEAELL